MRRFCSRAAVFVATGAYLSYIPGKLTGRDGKWTGAGLVGSLEGLALLTFLPQAGAPLWMALAAAVFVSFWICESAEAGLGRHDDPRIVLDEVVGMWVAAAALPRTAPALAAAFLLFRLFDTVKPPPCRALERLPGGVGVVMDDVGAGLLANLGARILMHGGFLR